MWIEIEEADGTKLGVIATARRWQHHALVDKAGTISFEMPAGDPAAALLQGRRRARCYAVINGLIEEQGGGIVDQINVAPGRPSMLRMSGPDLLGELGERSVMELAIKTKAWTYLTPDPATGAALGSVRWIQAWQKDGDKRTSDTSLANAFNGVLVESGANVQLEHWGTSDRWLYVGHEQRYSRVRVTLNPANLNTKTTTLWGQYWNGSGWATLSGLSDGTASGGKTLAQDGEWVYTEPADWQRNTPTVVAGDWFWTRYNVGDGTETDTVKIREIEVYADVPTTDGVNQVMALAPSTWTRSGYPATSSAAYVAFDGESVLTALRTLAAQTGQHFRLGTGRAIEWFTAFSDSGLLAVQGGAGTAIEDNDAVCLITGLDVTRDVSELATRVIPYGEGVTLAATTRTAPAGYTLSKAGNYIRHDAAETEYGRIEQVVRWPEISLQQDDSYVLHPAYAANALFDTAYEWLRTHCIEVWSYSLDVAKVAGTLAPGYTIDVVYHEWRDGYHAVDVDTLADGVPLYVIGVTREIDGDGMRIVGLDLANIDRSLIDDAEVVAEIAQGLERTQAASSGASQAVSEVITYTEASDALINSLIADGIVIVPHDAGQLAAAAVDTDTSIDFGQAMTAGDVVRIRAGNTVEYLLVGSLASGTRYNVTRDLDSDGATDWPIHTPYAVLGHTGNGRIEIDSRTTPRLTLLVQGATYNAQTEMVRLGDLNGNWGYSTVAYGLALGQYASGQPNVTIDPANGLRIRNYTTVLMQLDAAGNATIAGWMLNAASLVGGAATLAAAGYLLLGSGNDVARLDAADPTYRLWAGHATAAGAPFSVTKAGYLYAKKGGFGGTAAAPVIVLDDVSARVFVPQPIYLGDDDTGIEVGGSDGGVRFIQSNNFESGVAGWRIDNNGNAEFNDVAARGSLNAASGAVVIDASGLTLTAVDQAASMTKWKHLGTTVAQHRTRYTSLVSHYVEARGYTGDAALYLEARHASDGSKFARITLDSSVQLATVTGHLAVSGLMAGEKRNHEIFKNNTATAEHWLILTLPVSSSATLDHALIRAVYGGWTSAQKTYAQILVSNRGAFYQASSLLGATPSNSYARLSAYLQADGSINVYVFLAANSYSVCNYEIECPQAGVTVYATPANAGATPPGTWQYTW